jgi:hypothetical protein
MQDRVSTTVAIMTAPPTSPIPESESAVASAWLSSWAVVLLCAVALGLHLVPIAQPVLLYDDFQILQQSYTWNAAWMNLWQPHNEHVMPLGRLSTGLLVQLAGRPTLLPVFAAWQGPLALMAGMLLLYLFVRRELGHSLYGLIAMALFGVTTQYREAVYWFSASFALLATDTLLVALLAAQRWRRTGHWPWLAGCALACALAQGWFASGILAGPLCCLYLLPADRGHRPTARSLLTALLPLIGTGAFCALGLWRNLDHIMHLEHWGDKDAVSAFDPWVGLGYTARSLVDNLLLGPWRAVVDNLQRGDFGRTTPVCPTGPVVVFLVLLLLGVAIWWRLATERRLLLLGLAMIFVSLWLTYSARSEWRYTQVANWSRYQVLPQLGLSLFIVGGLPRWGGWGLTAPLDPHRAWLSGLVLARLLEVLFAWQLARVTWHIPVPEQLQHFRRIEDMDARCRQHRIAAAAARQVLPPLQMPVSGTLPDGRPRVSGWEFLRGSDDPLPLEPTKVWEILTAP